MKKYLILGFLVAFSSSNAQYCSLPQKGFFNPPMKPSCVVNNSCTQWQIDSYNDALEQYYREIEQYNEQVRQYSECINQQNQNNNQW